MDSSGKDLFIGFGTGLKTYGSVIGETIVGFKAGAKTIGLRAGATTGTVTLETV